MNYKSVFDIIGPIMVGPSSSHTAGAAKIGLMANELFFDMPESVKVHFYGSFAKTHRGHGTDEATIGGVLGFKTFDPKIIDSLELAQKKNISVEFFENEKKMPHPNCVRLILENKNKKLDLVGISIGGGSIEIIEIDEFPVNLTGEYPALLLLHEDRFGMIANVSTILANNQYNIAKMSVNRKERGKLSLMVIEVDQAIDQELVRKLANLKHIINATAIKGS